MEQLHGLEKSLSGLTKGLPRMPKPAADWLSTNLWWLAIVGVVFGVFGIITAIGGLLLLMGLGATLGSIGAYSSVAYLGTFFWLSALVGLVGVILTTILTALAINPLKVKSKKGWDLLFASLVLNFVINVVQAVLVINIIGILFAALGAFIGLYILFELRGHFVGKKKIVDAQIVEPKKV